jgi:hypothetical protein
MEKQYIAKIISNEKEFLLSSKVTILGKMKEIYEDEIYYGSIG